MMNKNKKNQGYVNISALRGAVYGVAVGDAVGIPVQFLARDSYEEVTDMIGYGTFHLPEGNWSDDTSLTLATCDSIRKKGKVDVKDIRKCFEKWYYDCKYTPFDVAYDIGCTCMNAIEQKKGMDDIRSNGNGSLMRILPLAFVNEITDEEVAEVSAITHAHAIAKEGCVHYVKIAQGLLAGEDLKSLVMKCIPEDSIYARIRGIENLPREDIRSSGYVVDTFEAAIWCLLTTDSYKSCIVKAVNLGLDTDTVAAVAGGLAGIIYSYEGIPKNWIEKLKAKDVIDGCINWK